MEQFLKFVVSIFILSSCLNAAEKEGIEKNRAEK
mgnify:CR=1 FL=1